MKTLFFQESFVMFLCIMILGICLTCLFPSIYGKIWQSVVVILLFLIYFYREEDRHMNRSKDELLAVSDGKVMAIHHDKTKRTIRIVVFLNIFDQHQQYYPCDGKVICKKYTKGHFHPAYLLEKSQYNERMKTVIRTCKDGSLITITQIAGQIARRIVNVSKVGERIQQGSWMGMIKLSSRVDVEFSEQSYTPNVSIGEKIYAKKTILAIRNKQ